MNVHTTAHAFKPSLQIIIFLLFFARPVHFKNGQICQNWSWKGQSTTLHTVQLTPVSNSGVGNPVNYDFSLSLFSTCRLIANSLSSVAKFQNFISQIIKKLAKNSQISQKIIAKNRQVWKSKKNIKIH